MLYVLCPLLLLPHDTQAGKDDVMIVEPSAMIVEPSADGRWKIVEQSSLASSTQTTTQNREARKGKVEQLDLFQVEKGRNEEVDVESAEKSSVTLDLFEAEKKVEEPKRAEERGVVNLNLFVNKTRRRNIDRDSKAFALISQSPSGNWVQRDSSKNKVHSCLYTLYTLYPF